MGSMGLFGSLTLLRVVEAGQCSHDVHGGPPPGSWMGPGSWVLGLMNLEYGR